MHQLNDHCAACFHPRLASTPSIQGVKSVWDLKWNDKGVTYADVFKRSEIEYCQYNFEHASTKALKTLFDIYEQESTSLADQGLAQPAFDQCLKAGHTFNLMEARGMISVTERVAYIARIRHLSKLCCELWVKKA